MPNPSRELVLSQNRLELEDRFEEDPQKATWLLDPAPVGNNEYAEPELMYKPAVPSVWYSNIPIVLAGLFALSIRGSSNPLLLEESSRIESELGVAVPMPT